MKTGRIQDVVGKTIKSVSFIKTPLISKSLDIVFTDGSVLKVEACRDNLMFLCTLDAKGKVSWKAE